MIKNGFAGVIKIRFDSSGKACLLFYYFCYTCNILFLYYSQVCSITYLYFLSMKYLTCIFDFVCMYLDTRVADQLGYVGILKHVYTHYPSYIIQGNKPLSCSSKNLIINPAILVFLLQYLEAYHNLVHISIVALFYSDSKLSRISKTLPNRFLKLT